MKDSKVFVSPDIVEHVYFSTSVTNYSVCAKDQIWMT